MASSNRAPALHAHSVSFGFSSAVPLFEGVELHLPMGFTGVVGENGAGKTTLLRLLAGALSPDEGSVRREPPEARIVECPQLVEQQTEDIEAFARAAAEDGEARRLVAELALDREALARWSTLSPGERKRWQIGAALWLAPDVLLLDEPTNHLDDDGRALLIEALERFDGVCLVVSHDRALLARLTTRTLRLHRGRVHLHAGSYDAARREWEAHERGQREDKQRLIDDQRALARRLDHQRRALEGADLERNARRRMRDKNDSDARAMSAGFRAESAEKRHGRTVSVVRDKLARAREATTTIALDKALGRSVFAGYERARTPRILGLDADELRAGDRPLLRDVHVVVGREDRICIEGANGAGKTTLVRALLAASRLPPERVLVLPQDLPVSAARALLDDVRALPKDERGRVLSIVAALGVEPSQLLASRDPSPGEARKLAVALGLGRHVWAMVLDEPTNHLDLPSIERLEEALRAFPGALLLVTHDVRFARRCTSTAWRVAAGRLQVVATERVN